MNSYLDQIKVGVVVTTGFIIIFGLFVIHMYEPVEQDSMDVDAQMRAAR